MHRIKVHNAKNIVEKIVGLIGSREPSILLIKTRFGIHTIGLRFPIDVIILNNSNVVMYLKENLAVNRVFLWNPKYCIVIELPAGTVKKEKISVGEKIQVEFRESLTA